VSMTSLHLLITAFGLHGPEKIDLVMDVGHLNMLVISLQEANHAIIAQRRLRNVHSTIHLERRDEKVPPQVLNPLQVNVRTFQGGTALPMVWYHYSLP
jgi:hypothetical protein